MALLEVKLRPTGPWRIGHRTGDRERVEAVYHSDALFSAVTHAMRSLGHLDEWLDATVRGEGVPAVRFSSLFPFAGNTRLVPPPKTSWPPAAPSRLYLKGAKLVPLEVALASAAGAAFDDNRYAVDGESGCLIPGGASAPFHVSVRSSVAVDRLDGTTSNPHRTACLEFHPRAGWWGLVDIANMQWDTRVRAAFRLLADSGFGGERSRGWGRASEPEFHGVTKLFPEVESPGAWWLLSLYSPHATDAVDWSRGEYAMQTRGGWTDSTAGQTQKKFVRMVEEGSVLAAASLRGQAVDVAPAGFAHPVYRCGFSLAIPIALAGLQVIEPVVATPVSAEIPEALSVESSPTETQEEPPSTVAEAPVVVSPAEPETPSIEPVVPAIPQPADSETPEAPETEPDSEGRAAVPPQELKAIEAEPPLTPVEEPPTEDPSEDEPPATDPDRDDPPLGEPGFDDPDTGPAVEEPPSDHKEGE